jgi:MoaA/NifB/PqqE/SkfB family radical SAM enzyme
MEKSSSIKDIVVAVTYQCNSRCLMCSIWKKKEMPKIMPADFLFLPDSLVDLNISGGEPFLRPDLPEFVVNAKKRKRNLHIVISTNGFATDLIVEQMKKIIKIDPQIGVAVSIDGLAQIHNRVRGIENGFVLAMNTIRGLKALGLKKLKIAFTIADYNYQELQKVYELSRELDLELSLTLVHSAENFFSQENKINKGAEIIRELEWLMKEELRTWNLKKWARAYYTYGMIQFIKTGKRILPDYSGRLNVFVDPDGFIYPSDTASEKIGHLKNGLELNNPKLPIKDSWMICTARPAIKKHPWRAIVWLLKNKF